MKKIKFKNREVNAYQSAEQFTMSKQIKVTKETKTDVKIAGREEVKILPMFVDATIEVDYRKKEVGIYAGQFGITIKVSPYTNVELGSKTYDPYAARQLLAFMGELVDFAEEKLKEL